MKYPNYLIVTVALLLTSAACSTIKYVPVSPPSPLACLTKCGDPPSLPSEDDNLGRLTWELEMIDGYGACYSLHNDCVSRSKTLILQ